MAVYPKYLSTLHLLPDWISDPDTDMINFHEPDEVNFWISQWKTTEAELIEAMKCSGTAIVNQVYKELVRAKLIHILQVIDESRNGVI